MSGKVVLCGGCGSGRLATLFDMGRQPLPEGKRAGRPYPLCLAECEACGLVQLDYVVDQAEVFAKDHPYSTGNSAALRAHYKRLVTQLDGLLEDGDVVVDIGANDGTLLSYYAWGITKVAVEPTDQILKCEKTIQRYREFFTPSVASYIVAEQGKAKVVTACNVLAHVPDVHEFLDGVYALLDDDGVFVTENHDLYSIIGGLQIDTIYHEHLRYYSAATLTRLLEQHNLRVTGIRSVDTHGGSFRVTACKVPGDFVGRAVEAATALRGMLWKLTEAEHKTVYGVGAATRAVPLILYAGISPMVTVCCEVAGSDKIGTRLPGTQIPVVDESALIGDQPEYALLFAWHMAHLIVPKLRAAGYKGKFIVPLPEPKVLDG